MWKNPVGNAIRVNSNIKTEINALAMETITTHIQIESFKGSRNDEQFIYIKQKLLHHLELLQQIKLRIHDKADVEATNEIEMNIKRGLTDLEVKATLQKGHLAKTHNASKLPFEYEKGELLKVENILQQVKKEVNDLEVNFETHTNTENLCTVNNLEEKIVSIYKDLEIIEDSPTSELKKIKDDLYRDLFRCSGRLKKARRKSSVTPPDDVPITHHEVNHLKTVENSNQDLTTPISTLSRHISQTLNTDMKGSQVAAKIKAQTLKLAWDGLKQHLYSENVSVDVMMEMIDEIDGLTKDMHLNNREFKRYVRNHRSDREISDGGEKERLKEIVERLKIVKRKIGCFQGYYKDESYGQLVKEIEGCLDMLKGVDTGGDVKLDFAKTKIKHKILEYWEMLDEKSVKA